jgi:hypothetical protein
MWGFLAFIIIVAIALGVTLQQAFWGIVTFCIGLVVFLIVSALFGYGVFTGAALIKKYNTPEAKAARKIKRRQALSDAAVTIVIFLWFASPWLAAILPSLIASTIGKDAQYESLAVVVENIVAIGCLTIFFCGILWAILFVRDMRRKNQPQKRKR